MINKICKNNLNKKNIFQQNFDIKRQHREKIHGHKGCIIWFTGISGSGKSTIANELEKKLNKNKISTYILDGDNIRYGLCNDLDFNDKHRKENMRRVGEVAKIMLDAGLIVLVTLISPYKKERKKIREMVNSKRFFEIFIDTPISLCEKRDSKGLYKKAKSGMINCFTGIESSYEIPTKPDIYLNGKQSLQILIKDLIKFLKKKKLLKFNFVEK